MSEGELKKRIKAREVTTIEGSIRTLFPLDVYTILDEARKDFPTLHEFSKEHLSLKAADLFTEYSLKLSASVRK